MSLDLLHEATALLLGVCAAMRGSWMQQLPPASTASRPARQSGAPQGNDEVRSCHEKDTLLGVDTCWHVQMQP